MRVALEVSNDKPRLNALGVACRAAPFNIAEQRSGLSRDPHKVEIAGSNPASAPRWRGTRLALRPKKASTVASPTEMKRHGHSGSLKSVNQKPSPIYLDGVIGQSRRSHKAQVGVRVPVEIPSFQIRKEAQQCCCTLSFLGTTKTLMTSSLAMKSLSSVRSNLAIPKRRIIRPKCIMRLRKERFQARENAEDTHLPTHQ